MLRIKDDVDKQETVKPANHVPRIASQMWSDQLDHLLDDFMELVNGSGPNLKLGSLDLQAKHINIDKVKRIINELKSRPDEIAHFFSMLHVPHRPNIVKFNNSLKFVISEMANLAFAQHYFNPEHFVSHDFWHGLKVGTLVLNGIIDAGDLIQLELEKDLARDTATFAAAIASTLHDVGYPIQDKQGSIKASHAPIGSTLLERQEFLKPFLDLLQISHNQEVQKNDPIHKKLITKKLCQIVARHGSDKEEKPAHGATNKDLLIVILENIGPVIINTKEQKGWEKFLETGEISGQKYKIVGFQFGGRVATYINPDFRLASRFGYSQEGFLGMQKTTPTIESQPEEALVRLADNADETWSRLSKLQHHGIFLNAWLKVEGFSGPPIGQLIHAEELNSLDNYRTNRFNEIAEYLRNNKTQKAIEVIDVLLTEGSLTRQERDMLTHLQKEDLTVNKFMQAIFECAAAEYATCVDAQCLPVEQEYLSEMSKAMANSHSRQGRHYIGCYPIKSSYISFENEPIIVVYNVDDKMISKLNAVSVQDSPSSNKVPLGLYKLMRAGDAYHSVSYYRQSVICKVNTGDGELINMEDYIAMKMGQLEREAPSIQSPADEQSMNKALSTSIHALTRSGEGLLSPRKTTTPCLNPAQQAAKYQPT